MSGPCGAPVVLAFGFASPALLFLGAALGSLPIIVHLLHRRQYRETTWAAMRFLLAATRRTARRMRLEQLVLLAVRVLVLLLLCAAAARPYVESFGEFFQAAVPTHRILVLDASFGMGDARSGTTRFEAAQEALRQLLDRAQPGDAFQLVRMGGRAPHAIVRQPTWQAAQVLAEIDRAALTDERGDLRGALEEVARMTEEVPEIPRKEVTIVSDLQRSDWLPETSGETGRVRTLLKGIAQRAALRILDLGQADAANAAVVDLAVDEPFVAAGRTAALHAVVRNFGPRPLSGWRTELLVDGRVVETRTPDLPPGQDVRLDFGVRFETGGEHAVEVRIEEDSLPTDDRRFLAVPVKDELRVLLVNGRPSGRAMGNATDHLLLALAPSSGDRPSPGLIRPTVIVEGELPGTDLSRFDCVFACNLGLLAPRETDLFRAYVEGGGSVVFTLGDQVRPAEFERPTGGTDEAPLLPVRIRGVRTAAPDAPGFGFDALDHAHPIVSAFQGNPDAGLETARVRQYAQLEIADPARTRTVLKFSTGDPALVESRHGRGTILVLAASVDAEWGTWVLWPAFPPLMHEIVAHAVSGRWGERRLLVGEPLLRTFPASAFGTGIVLKTPAAPDRPREERPLRLDETGRLPTLAYDGIDRAGLYELVLGPPTNRTESVAAVLDRRESDPAKIDATELRTALLPDVDFAYRTRWEEPVPQAAKTTARGGLSRWLLALVLGLLLVEQVMAWRFGWGVVAAYVLVAGIAAWQAAQWNAGAGLLAAAAALAGAYVLARRTRAADRAAGSGVPA
jgi:hypothetical protein